MFDNLELLKVKINAGSVPGTGLSSYYKTHSF